MNNLLKGYTYDLEKLIRVEGGHAFILETGGSEKWDNETHQNLAAHCYDLGKQRILRITKKEAYLILILEKGTEYKMEISRLDPSGCKVADLIREKGCHCCVIAEYGGKRGKDGIVKGFIGQTWEMALNKREGEFSEAGYALQYRGWLDYTFYRFELFFMNRGRIIIDGHDVEGFALYNVMEDIMLEAGHLIDRVLKEKMQITGKDLADALKAAELEEYIKFLNIYEWDDVDPITESNNSCHV